MEQLTESGCYTGGSIPYGYQLDKRGQMNIRSREVFDLVIDEDAAKIIQLILDKYVYEGFGAQRLCRYLTEMNIRKPNRKNFPKSVYACRDCTLEIEFNVSFEDFRTMATECQEQGRNQQPVVYVMA